MHTIQRVFINASAFVAVIVWTLSGAFIPATAGTSGVDADSDSYPDCYEQDAYKSDHDNDGTKDSDDADDDNDGIADTEDSKPKDKDNDGTSDQLENRLSLTSANDADADGYLDTVEKSEYQKNHDQDSTKDSDDADDDNDGLVDSGEADKMKRNHDNDKKDGKGYQDRKDPDNDQDGINDWDETKCAYIYDHDNDGIKDAKDTDDDNDDIEDTEDANLNDSDNDGVKDNKDDDSEEEFSLTPKRIFYGYLVSDYDNNGDGVHETEHLVSEGAFLYMGAEDGRLMEVEVSQSGSAERTETEGVFEYTVSDTSQVTTGEAAAAYAGRIDPATGEYQFAFGEPEDQPKATYINSAGDTSTFYWPKMTLIGAGGGNDEDCNAVDLADNGLDSAGDCAYTITSEGLMKGEFLDQTSNYDERGSQRTARWKLVPTSCESIEGCTRPASSYPSEDDYKDNDDTNS